MTTKIDFLILTVNFQNELQGFQRLGFDFLSFFGRTLICAKTAENVNKSKSKSK